MSFFNKEKKFAGLDHLRALAISMVLLYHYRNFNHPQWIDNIVSFGWTGVDLFFILSGFLISNQLFFEIQEKSDFSIKKFYIKRAFRILPPYFFILLIYIFIPVFHEREQLSPLWKMFTFTQNLGLNITVTGTFSHSWSLCVEEQFYLIFPLLLLFLLKIKSFRKAGWLIPAIFFLTMLLRLALWHFFLEPIKDQDDFNRYWYQWIYYPTDTRLDGLITGVGIASIYRFRQHWLPLINRYANALIIAGIIFVLLTMQFATDPHQGFATVFGFSLVALVFGLFVFSAVLPASILFRFKSGFTKSLATLSYSLYLCHKGLIHLTQQALQDSFIPEDSTAMLVICLSVCVAGALCMRIFIEKPSMRMRDKFLEKIRTVKYSLRSS
jgi:peptidoglycan/LPS O-acetylase OafA/YrhL